MTMMSTTQADLDAAIEALAAADAAMLSASADAEAACERSDTRAALAYYTARRVYSRAVSVHAAALRAFDASR